MCSIKKPFTREHCELPYIYIYPTHPLPNILRLFLRLISNTVINRLLSIDACVYSSVLLPDILHTMSKPILPQSSSRRYRTPPLNHYVFENEACLSSVTAVETSLSSSLLFLTNVPHIVLKPSARREAIYMGATTRGNTSLHIHGGCFHRPAECI